MLDQDNEENSLEMELENAVINSLEDNHALQKRTSSLPDQIYIFPLIRRPFFPEWQLLLSSNRVHFMKY